MSLLQLPPEILIQVMNHVGSSYFREDLGRLTVCKQWFRFARTACFKDLQLFQKTLRRLLSSREVGRSLLLIKDSLEILDLGLKGFEGWSSIPESQSYPQDVNALVASSWDGDLGRALLTAWTTALDNDLAQLAITAKESRKLRIIRIQASSEHHPLLPLLPRRDYLSLSTIRAFLSGKNLTALELDLCGTLLMPRQEHRDDFHVCTSIGALLTTLRRLRLRMRSICADVLRPQHHDTSLRLSEVLINLSLSNESPMTTSAAHSTRCGPTGGGFLKLKADIEDQAEALAAHMVSPKIIRILTHTLPQLEMRSLDVLTGKCMKLADDMAWEDDGGTVQDDSDLESEILGDDFSTPSDE
ncbi:uncharacterized protein BDR25DRAFT_122562 [Lindgomyces ingoldianus]|uniref:Uncharacterized protein n=1 Tax=Lindgomyces ingoldianus TaxID=673940 RepID=A0ACB6Q7J3_9PLEO|nr:uncharacterized protein BDR25DRAFT_122562 [Lindgomyces ingoldianus]KAF2462814.1 hypothetical protein BDR25DRAFT_122562 [Lindgomyces ingoldianus]